MLKRWVVLAGMFAVLSCTGDRSQRTNPAKPVPHERAESVREASPTSTAARSGTTDAERARCGKVTCTAGEVCCNPSCGICTPPDGVCTQQICD